MVCSYNTPLTPALLLNVPVKINKVYAEKVKSKVMWGFFQLGSIFPFQHKISYESNSFINMILARSFF